MKGRKAFWWLVDHVDQVMGWTLGVGLLVWLALGVFCSGCATLGRVEQLEHSIARIDTSIGGGGDSVTAWIYAAIAGASVIYPAYRVARGGSIDPSKRK